MMKGVARVFKYPPSELYLFYLDNQDALGLEFWFNDAEAYQKEQREAIAGLSGKRKKG